MICGWRSEFFVEVRDPAKAVPLNRGHEATMGQKLALQDLQIQSREVSLLRFLSPSQVVMIDEALSALGEFGEVRLVVEKGRLRFVVTQNSHDALKWQPGSLNRKGAG